MGTRMPSRGLRMRAFRHRRTATEAPSVRKTSYRVGGASDQRGGHQPGLLGCAPPPPPAYPPIAPTPTPPHVLAAPIHMHNTPLNSHHIRPHTHAHAYNTHTSVYMPGKQASRRVHSH